MCENKRILWEELKNISCTTESNMDALERKRTGSYYTSLELTDVMMAELVEALLSSKKDVLECKFLEPCVGTGNFVFSYLKKLASLNLSADDYMCILNNIYVSDINKKALFEYSNMLKKFASIYWDIELSEAYFSTHISDGLLLDVSAEVPQYITIQNAFPTIDINDGFDIVVTNPPYKNLKAERGHYPTCDDYEVDKVKYEAIGKIVRNNFYYSSSGVLNLYKVFVEEIIDKYAKADAFVSLLIPASILSDKTSKDLRTHILSNHSLRTVKMIKEGSKYIDAQQALCALLIKKGKPTDSVCMTKDYCASPNKTAEININDIMSDATGNAIFSIDDSEYDILKKLRKWTTVGELDFIINLRGELDLTANKHHITKENTGYPLIRGRDIGYYKEIGLDAVDYAEIDFVLNTKKNKYTEKQRIICQQIANVHKQRRVTFAIAPPHVVLANSCNFLAVNANPYGISEYTLLGLFNSDVINWFFKLTSSNNHINNYEIDSFPIPLGSPFLNDIDKCVKEYLKKRDDKLIAEINKLVENAYGISNDHTNSNYDDKILTDYFRDIRNIAPNISLDEAKLALESYDSAEKYLQNYTGTLTKEFECLIKKYKKLVSGEILNHTTFKLSELDLEMVRAVPQGGSWKNIPMETVKKSKRLMRINETGGRTTLYGRIDYNKPSYTITTYFNRPGNGTYIHPIHDRVLSVREAARFQCFPDSYYFYGNKNQLLKQVGNAVPSILAYQIASQIMRHIDCKTSIDLFCGAGGMTIGFKAAGIKSVLCNDIEESACITIKTNNPEIPVLCGDITTSDVKEKIINVAKTNKVDMICGGPPCQGFSMAGLRLADDPRNQLFKDFISVVSCVMPKVVVFENVEGLLSHQGGKTYNIIHSMFSNIGYETEGRKLVTTEYAIPQKRKRVIIICTRKDLGVSPNKLFPKILTPLLEQQVNAKETIGDLNDIACEENAKYIQEPTSNIAKFLRGKLSYEAYVGCYSNQFDDNENYIEIDSVGQLELAF